jgi:hypothetical protein
MYIVYLFASVYLGMSFAHGSHDLFTPVLIVSRFSTVHEYSVKIGMYAQMAR